MTDEDYCANLYELETRFLKTEKSLGSAESTQEYTEAIDSILDFINERAKYRVADLKAFKVKEDVNAFTEETEIVNLYLRSKFPRERLLSLIADEIFLSSKVSSKEDLGIRKFIEARNTNKEFSYELAKMFCGDNSLFLYRSSSFITGFFKEAGFPFVHDGSTRARWIEDRIEEINAKDLFQKCLQRLFKERDFQEVAKRRELPISECVLQAKTDLKQLLDKSLEWDRTIDFSDIVGLNVKSDLLFNKKTTTHDITLNELIDVSKDFLITGDYQSAIEKLWDALERLKSLLDDDKKTSVGKIVQLLSSDIESAFFDCELGALTKIGNDYQIRHFEPSKKPIRDFRTQEYLYFRLLSLVDFILSKIQ